MSSFILIMWNFLSFLVSGVFVFQGLMMFREAGSNLTLIVSALVVLSYGLITILVQSINWNSPSKKFVKFIGYLVVLMFLNHILFRSGLTSGSGSGINGLALITMMLAINWLAIDYVAEHKKPKPDEASGNDEHNN